MQIIVRTKENIVKKQGMTFEEIEKEHEEVNFIRRFLIFILCFASAI